MGDRFFLFKIASREILPMTVTKMRLKAEFVSNADENEAEGRDQLIEFLAFRYNPNNGTGISCTDSRL